MQPIHLVLAPSKYLANFFLWLHSGAALMLLWAWVGGDLPFLLVLSNLLCILFSWSQCLQKHAYRTAKNAIKTISYEPSQAGWTVQFMDGEAQFFTLSGDSALIFGVALLKFKQAGHFLTTPTLVCRDTVGKENFRQLRKWWRCYGQTGRSF